MQESQHEPMPIPAPSELPEAPSFQPAPYVMVVCTKDGCARATSVTSGSAKACAYSLDAMSMVDGDDVLADGRLYKHNDRSRWYECKPIPVS